MVIGVSQEIFPGHGVEYGQTPRSPGSFPTSSSSTKQSICLLNSFLYLLQLLTAFRAEAAMENFVVTTEMWGNRVYPGTG